MLIHTTIFSQRSRSVISVIAIAVFLCAMSGCRAPFRSQRSTYHPSYAAGLPTSPSVVSSAENSSLEPPPEVPPASTAELLKSEEEIRDGFRLAGGKLRPDESGEIVEIDLSYSEVTDEQLADLTVFGQLTEIDLTGTRIHDDGIAALASLQQLRSVKLKGTKITNEGLKQLATLTNLIFLDASNTSASDEGLEQAEQWSLLRYLSLNNTTVSDTGLNHLGKLRELKGLSVINTAVTNAGVRSLKKQLPDCLIVAQTGRELGRQDANESLPRLADPGSRNSSFAGTVSQEQLDQVAQLAGQQPHLAVHLSQVYSSRDQWLETAQILAVAAAADPENEAIHFRLGEALARIGRPAEALVHFEQAVDEASARYQVALITYENSLRDCERLFDEALAADPSLTEAESRINRIQQEIAQLKRQRAEPAIPQLDATPFDVVPAPVVRSASRSRVLPMR